MNIFKDRMGRHLAKQVAKKVDKEDFLRQLKEAWTPEIKKHADVQEVIANSRARIEESGLADVFKTAKVTDEDLEKVIREIQAGKSDPVTAEKKVGRNELCPCGSGKKYKHCCGG